MTRSRMACGPVICPIVVAVCLSGRLQWAIGAENAPPIPPKTSSFAPAPDLVHEVDRYIKDLEDAMATEDEYKDSQIKVAQNANTLIVLALALGLHDQPSKYKDKAGTIMDAARGLTTSKDYQSAKKAVEAVKAAANSGQGGGPLKWEKVASLPELMKEVPFINTKLKRYAKPRYFKRRAAETAGYTASIAAIAQGSIADTSEAKDPAQIKQWYELMAAMRDHAGALNAAIHKGEQAAADSSMQKLQKSCDACHEVFHPGVQVE